MTVRGMAIGSLLPAFLSSWCCVGPLILGVLGAGAGATSSYMTVLVPYRPAFIALTFIFLGIAFYSIYRRTEACATDQPCPASATTALKIVLWVATIMALSLILLPELLAVGI